MDILCAAKHHRMFRPGDTVLAAVSGGPDSVAMLHALYTRREELGINLHAAHLNHGIRGEESNSDEVFVRNLAQTYGLQIAVKRVDIPSIRAQMRVGEEEAAREERYKFLQETAAIIGASKIAVGHTADDRAESVLLNIIRGTGIDGLGSIRPVRGNIVRPLIDTYRSEIEAYVRENNLDYRTDTTNLDVTYARNRVRHELLPLLQSNYNPNIRKALVQLAEISADQSDYMSDSRDCALHFISREGALDAGLFLELPRAMQYQLLRAELLRHKGDLKDVSFEQIDRIIVALQEGKDFTITLPSGKIYATREGTRFCLWRKVEVPKIEPFDMALSVPGKTIVQQVELMLDARIVETPEVRKLPPDEVMISSDAIAGPLRVRNVHAGDRIVPFGMRSPKKLQDIFVDKKIPRDKRARAAVVVDDEKILWVVGVVASEAARITEGNRAAVYIRGGIAG